MQHRVTGGHRSGHGVSWLQDAAGVGVDALSRAPLDAILLLRRGKNITELADERSKRPHCALKLAARHQIRRVSRGRCVHDICTPKRMWNFLAQKTRRVRDDFLQVQLLLPIQLCGMKIVPRWQAIGRIISVIRRAIGRQSDATARGAELCHRDDLPTARCSSNLSLTQNARTQKHGGFS